MSLIPIPRWSNGEHHAPPMARKRKTSVYLAVVAFVLAYALLAILICFPRIITGL